MPSTAFKVASASILTFALAACGKSAQPESASAPSVSSAASASSAPSEMPVKSASNEAVPANAEGVKHVVFAGKFGADIPANMKKQVENSGLAVYANLTGIVTLVAAPMPGRALTNEELVKQTLDNMKQKYDDSTVIATREITANGISLSGIEVTMTDPKLREAYMFMAMGAVDGKVVAVTVLGKRSMKDALLSIGDRAAKSITRE